MKNSLKSWVRILENYDETCHFLYKIRFLFLVFILMKNSIIFHPNHV